MKINRTIMVSLALLSGFAGSLYAANSQGTFTVKAGLASVHTEHKSGLIKHSVLGPVAGTKAYATNASNLGVTFTYIVRDHVGVELLAALPFKHDIRAKNLLGANSNVKVGSAKQLPPTLSLQYYLANPEYFLQPYVGVGVNYTFFFSEDTSSAMKNSALGFRDLSLSSSWGLSAQAGVNLNLNDKWMLNASVWKVDIDTKAKFSKTTSGATAKVNVDIDPMVYMVGVGYNFV